MLRDRWEWVGCAAYDAEGREWGERSNVMQGSTSTCRWGAAQVLGGGGGGAPGGGTPPKYFGSPG